MRQPPPLETAIVLTEHSIDRIMFLNDAIYALNSQTFNNFSIILVDDTGKGLLKKYFEHLNKNGTIPRIGNASNNIRKPRYIIGKVSNRPEECIRFRNLMYVQNSKNLGASASCNIGIETAIEQIPNLKYLAFQDGDDISLYDRMRLQKEYLDNNNDVECVTGDKLEFGQVHFGRQTKMSKPKEECNGEIVTDKDCYRVQAGFFGACVFKTNFMIKRSLLDKGFRFDDSYPAVGDDIIMNARLAKLGGIGYITLPLVYYRRHFNNLSKTQSGEKFDRDYARAIKQVLRENAGIVDKDDEWLRKFYRIFHIYDPIPGYQDFVEEVRVLLKKCEFVSNAAVDKVLDGALINLKMIVKEKHKNIKLPNVF